MTTVSLTPLPKPVTATVSIPGSKSYTNRALIMAALTKGTVEILNPLFSDDTEAMINCLKTLGIAIEVEKNRVLVIGDISQVKDAVYDLNANLSGTTIRFILALICLVPGTKTLQGKESLNKRPIKELVTGLGQLGADITYLDKEGFPPIKVLNSISSTTQNVIKMNGDISSQYFSAVLMIAPWLNGVTIEVTGTQISKSYIDMTIHMMEDWGVQVVNNNYQSYSIPANQKYQMKSYTVEGDYSAAGYFFALAALTNSTITLQNINANSKQGDKNFVHILEKMGNKIEWNKSTVTVHGRNVKPIEVDMELCPDQAQTLAVLSAFANGITKLTGVRSLRVKETERVKAVQTELVKMGIKTESPDEDTLIIYGGNPKPTAIDTYHDHRMAMSFAVAGSKLDGMIINDSDVVNKTFPTFWEKLSELGIQVTRL